MPELEVSRGDQFLRQVADGLPFDEAGEARHSCAKLASHIVDSTARFESEGLTLDEAENTGTRTVSAHPTAWPSS